MAIQAKIETIRPNTSAEQIALYLPIAQSLSDCLEVYGEDLSELTQALVVLHYIEQSTGSGEVTSESTRTGASASYDVVSGQGLASTKYGRQLLGLPTIGCVQSLIKGGRFAKSIRVCHGNRKRGY